MEPHERRYIVAMMCHGNKSGHVEAVSMLTRHLTRHLEAAAEERDTVGLDRAESLLLYVLGEVRSAWAQMPQPLPLEKVDKPSNGA